MITTLDKPQDNDTLKIPYPEVQKLNSIIGTIEIIIGLILTIYNIYFIGLVLIPVFLFYERKGLEFDFKQNCYRKYNRFFGFYSGKWKLLDPFTDIVVFNKQESKAGTITMALVAVGVIEMPIIDFQELYLMDKTHLRRIFIMTSNNKTSINKMIQTIVEKSDKQVVKYNPQRLNRRK